MPRSGNLHMGNVVDQIIDQVVGGWAGGGNAILCHAKRKNAAL